MTPNNQPLLKLQRHVFLGNILTFYKLHYYLQTNGVSMGSKCAPSATCVFMGDFKRQLLTNLLNHDVQFSCAITQPLLAHHWRVHQCLLTSHFTAPLIPWGASGPGGKMRKQLLKDHNFLNNSLIFITESSTLIYLLFKKHCIQYISI